MSEAMFKLAYGGEAVRNGEMDVADLAPALLGVAQLLKAAGRALDGDDAEIGVRVKATREGSFEVWLNIIVNDAKVAWEFWKSTDVQAAANLLQILGFTGVGGVIGALRLIKGRRLRRIRADADRVVFELDGDEFEVPEPVARLVLDDAVRSALQTVVSDPLEKEGIDTLSVGDAKTETVIAKDEIEYFKVQTISPDDEFVSKYEKAFTIVSLSFKSGQKWRLNDGRANVPVSVSDQRFLERVDAGIESFAKNDMLICEVLERSRRTSSGFRSDYEIVRVIEHRHYQPPPPLFAGAHHG
ncbi:MAG: hypothetical protein AB1429_03945 [Pseudomonadota bacterium]